MPECADLFLDGLGRGVTRDTLDDDCGGGGMLGMPDASEDS